MDALADRLVATFCELVRIDSLSYEEGEFADAVEARLADLGLVTWRDDSAATTGSDTGNLFGRLDGLAGMPGIVLGAHLDTVEPGRGIEPVVQDDIVRSAGDTVLGADDKAGIAQILEALRTIQEAGHPHGDIEVVLTVAEEKSLVGAKAMDPKALAARACFVLDSHGDVGTATVAAPWQKTIKATVHGKAAHAGAEPEKGVSAIVAAAEAISAMRLGRIDHETTANIGRIEGGRATNIVPDLVQMAGEARSHDPAKLDAQVESMLAALRGVEVKGCWVEIDVIDDYHGFALAADHPLVRLFARACEKLDIEPTLMTSGGGSDANIFNDAGVPTLVLSTGMEQMHSTAEYIRIDQLVAGHDLIAALVAQVMAD